jgi:hypothetical protein
LKLASEEHRERNAAEVAVVPEFLAEVEGGRAHTDVGFEAFAAGQQHANAAFETDDKPPSYDSVVNKKV